MKMITYLIIIIKHADIVHIETRLGNQLGRYVFYDKHFILNSIITHFLLELVSAPTNDWKKLTRFELLNFFPRYFHCKISTIVIDNFHCIFFLIFVLFFNIRLIEKVSFFYKSVNTCTQRFLTTLLSDLVSIGTQ